MHHLDCNCSLCILYSSKIQEKLQRFGDALAYIACHVEIVGTNLIGSNKNQKKISSTFFGFFNVYYHSRYMISTGYSIRECGKLLIIIFIKSIMNKT